MQIQMLVQFYSSRVGNYDARFYPGQSIILVRVRWPVTNPVLAEIVPMASRIPTLVTGDEATYSFLSPHVLLLPAFYWFIALIPQVNA